MALRIGTSLPSLAGATEWINGRAEPHDLLGHPVLIQFWAVSCPLCKINIPAVQRWEQLYGSHGLKVIAIHAPRYESDADIELVRRTVKEYSILEPCAIDNRRIISDAFQTGGIWPYYFLFDYEGKMRSRAAGTVGLRLLESALKRLLEKAVV